MTIKPYSSVLVFFSLVSLASVGCSSGGAGLPGDGLSSPDARGLPQSDKPTDPQFAALDGTLCLSDLEKRYGIPSEASLAGADYLGAYDLLGRGYNQTSAVRESLALGTACSGATDVAACKSKLASLEGAGWRWSGGDGAGEYAQLRATQGDTVRTFDTPEEAIALYLPIDTPRKALARISAARVGQAGCAYKKESDGSHLVIATLRQCKSQGHYEYLHKLYSIRPDGAYAVVLEQRTEKKDPQLGSCPS
ncbi:MAG: hypothetical protein U0174_15550 [Polyangiaceae bacterium]